MFLTLGIWLRCLETLAKQFLAQPSWSIDCSYNAHASLVLLGADVSTLGRGCADQE